jgi:hypothetical protein
MYNQQDTFLFFRSFLYPQTANHFYKYLSALMILLDGGDERVSANIAMLCHDMSSQKAGPYTF